MSETILKYYLLIVVLGGVYGVAAGLIVAFKNRPDSWMQGQIGVPGHSWKTFLRGLSTLSIGLCSFVLFRRGTLGGWTVFLSVAAFLVIQEYILNAICRPTPKKRAGE